MSTRRQIGMAEALLPLAVLVGLLVTAALTVGLSSELLVAIILAAAAAAGFSAVRHGATWADIQRATGSRFADVLPAILILLTIGMLIATWVLSGTIPWLVYWGVRFVRPELLVLTAFLATSAMSLATGTSWGSAGTIGVALMGTAAALDAPLGATAGAVVAGAYLGDKMSPLSDSTNICALGADAPLYAHIRHMMYTATPSFVVAVIVYITAARLAPVAGDGLPPSALVLLDDLDTAFSLHWLALLPPVVIVWTIVRRVPPALAITLSSLIAIGIGVFVQGFGVHDAVLAAVGGFRTTMLDARGIATGDMSPAFTTLVARGGLYSMAPTLIVILAAFL